MNILNDNVASVAAQIFALKCQTLMSEGKHRKVSLERISKEALADAEVFIQVWKKHIDLGGKK